MKVNIIEIAGLAPAIKALYISKRTLNEQIANEIDNTIWSVTDNKEFLKEFAHVDHPEEFGRFNDYMEKIVKWGIRYDHASLLDFIQIYTHIEGLHRGAGDDFDAHAGRMSAIIRSSTRLATHRDYEMSDWYKGKILYPSEFVDTEFEESVSYPDGKYVKTNFGFVREDLLGDKDVERGLVPLAAPQNNINCISYREWRYIYYRRGQHTSAAPELKNAMEMFKEELTKKMPVLGEYLDKVWSEPQKKFIPIGEAVYTTLE